MLYSKVGIRYTFYAPASIRLLHKIFKSPFLSADTLQAIRVCSSAQTKGFSDVGTRSDVTLLHHTNYPSIVEPIKILSPHQ